ncbi:MAG: transporter substrate-binding domain-containing protein [Caldilineaceae bacterium]
MVVRRYYFNLLWTACLLLAMSACTVGNPPQVSSTPVEAAAPTVAPTVPPTVAPTATANENPAAESEATPALLLARVGINAEFEPFVYKDEAGQAVGFDIDLITALSQAGNFEVTYLDMPFEQLLSKVETGELDAAISAITVTDERAEQVNFSDAYFQSGKAPVSYFNPGQGLAVRLDESTITGAGNLTSQVKVGVKADTTGAQYVATETDAEAVVYPEAADAFAALRNGDVDAVVIDIPVIVRYITNNTDTGVRITGGPLTDELYAIAVSPARDDLLERINGALAQIQRDGTYDQLFEKWFGSP